MSYVFSSIWPLKCSLSLLHIVKVLAHVLPPIRPREGPVPLHFVILPVPVVHPLVRPLINSDALDIVVVKVTRVRALVGPNEFATAVLLSFHVLPIVACPIWPPLHALPVRLVVLPVALVNVAVRVDQPPPTVCLVVFPVALVSAAVQPDLNAPAVANVRLLQPFTLVFCTVFQHHYWLFYPFFFVCLL